LAPKNDGEVGSRILGGAQRRPKDMARGAVRRRRGAALAGKKQSQRLHQAVSDGSEAQCPQRRAGAADGTRVWGSSYVG